VNLGLPRIVLVVAVLMAVVVACGDDDPAPAGTFTLPTEEAASYSTAYIAEVVADPPGDDLAEGAGEHVVIRNNADIRIDMGDWGVVVEGQRLSLGPGRQIDPDAEVRLHIGRGEDTGDAVFAGAAEEMLDDEDGLVILEDAGRGEVARFRYGG